MRVAALVALTLALLVTAAPALAGRGHHCYRVTCGPGKTQCVRVKVKCPKDHGR